MGGFTRAAHHPLLGSPAVALAFTSLALLLLVLVLLSVPGPIKGLFWFSIDGEQSQNGPMTAGVLGWCMTETSNCTYAPLSENAYLSKMINTGEALTVRMMLPLACYWMILTLITWVLLAITSGMGYQIRDLDSITRHLRFAVVEACVLCVSLFGNVLCWLAFGLGRNAYLSVERGGGKPKSGHAMETTAVAAMISLISLFFALWGLHLRMAQAQAQWKEKAVMVRRRSMMFARPPSGAASGPPPSWVENGGVVDADAHFDEKRASRRMSEEEYYRSMGMGTGTTPGGAAGGRRNSMIKDPVYPPPAASTSSHGHDSRDEEEEVLEAQLSEARRNSREQAMMISRASSLSPADTPYGAVGRQ